MARPMKPLVRGGGYYPSNRWIPLVYPGGYTTMNGGGEPTPSVVWVTVSGASPLSLVNAAASNIRSITQTGKTVQNGTPTPSAPVDIVCNNGAVKVRHQSGLPVRYQLLSNLRASANVDVGVKTTKNTELEAAWTRITSTAQYLYQSDSNSSGSTNTTAYVSSSGNWRFGNRTASITPSQNERFVSIQNSNGVSLNGEQVASYGTIGSFTSTNTLRVFGSGASLQVEYLKVRQSGELVRDLVPVHDTVDGTYGLYDLVGGTFYTNANATFTPGDEVDDPIEVVADGTPETLTVGDQTATVHDLYAVGDYKDEVDVISGTVTRRVGVKVCDGTESWQKVTGYNAYYVMLDDMRYCNPTEAGFSTHFVGNGSATASMPNNTVKLSYTSVGTGAIMFKCNAYTTIADWTAFVAAQYAAGTPVIIIYPLAEETTEQVAGQPLRTSAGTNVVSVTSEVDPVELSVEYAQPESGGS